MNCVQCASMLEANAAYCAACGHFVSKDTEAAVIRVERLKEWDRNMALKEVARVFENLDEAERAHFLKRVDATEPPGLPARAVSPAPVDKQATQTRQTGSVSQAPAKSRPTQTPQSRPAGTSIRSGITGTSAIFLDFNQTPAEIIAVMDKAEAESREHRSSRRRIRLILLAFVLAGIPFVILDFLLGYNFLTLSLVAYAFWAAAAFGFFTLWRSGKAPKFDTRYKIARTIFETIRDDIAKGKTAIGWLDLSGTEQPSKKYRRKTAGSGRPISYYKDEWFKLKTVLRDGTVLRVTVFEKRKVREGYYKRSLSGKRKYKPGSSSRDHFLRVAITPPPGVYDLPMSDLHGKQIPNSSFRLEQGGAANGRLTLSAATGLKFDAWDILETLRFGFSQLQPIGENSA